ncbi:uracil-DNA glycosylase [Paraburkholderia sp. J7]|uniref:uracil-DNA glycosylase n=1 Tax=Paraburkholderia sp. J7 TaxID=2805438 RepID=UPI002AB63A8D|nr:uracil-DNA glycosylase family protein [Paraburkholderia sp. J7]
MPLDEIALEELGLAPRWVRKGTQGGASLEASPDDAAVAPSPAVTRAEVEIEAPVVQAARPAAAVQPAEAQPAAPQPPQPVARAAAPSQPAPHSSDEPPPLTDEDFAWFDSVAQPVLPHEAEPAQTSGAPRNDVATLDWDALAERVASCTRCRLCEKRTNTVFGVGDRKADWMLIGEAPGENEDRQGEPFVGQAGKLLDNMLRALSLARGENVYIANVIKCRPPGNRNPEPDEVARCEPYLQRQVALVKPKIIVALGRFAAQSLLKTEGSIASLRGRVHEYEGVPVIVTYHPAYLLRSLHDKAKAWTDLCLARDTWRAASGGEQ